MIKNIEEIKQELQTKIKKPSQIERQRKTKEYENKIIYIIEPWDVYEVSSCSDWCCGMGRAVNNTNTNIEIKWNRYYDHCYVQWVYKTKEDKINFLKKYPFEMSEKDINNIINKNKND